MINDWGSHKLGFQLIHEHPKLLISLGFLAFLILLYIIHYILYIIHYILYMYVNDNVVYYHMILVPSEGSNILNFPLKVTAASFSPLINNIDILIC